MITIQHYDATWLVRFETEKLNILSRIHSHVVAIEHIGSTAVPGLAAKPTIDMCIGINMFDVNKAVIIESLVQLGYEYFPHYEEFIPDRLYFQQLDATGEHLFHIHVVLMHGPLWKEYLRFRNYLRIHPNEVQRYELLKHDLKQRFAHDRHAYTEGKAEFIREILAKALIWENAAV